VVAGDEVGVEMGLDDVFDFEVLLLGEVDVDVDVALGIDDGSDTFGGDHVGGVGETAEKELFDEYRFHLFALTCLALLIQDDSTGVLLRALVSI
jgi:hypothetical protein